VGAELDLLIICAEAYRKIALAVLKNGTNSVTLTELRFKLDQGRLSDRVDLFASARAAAVAYDAVLLALAKCRQDSDEAKCFGEAATCARDSVAFFCMAVSGFRERDSFVKAVLAVFPRELDQTFLSQMCNSYHKLMVNVSGAFPSETVTKSVCRKKRRAKKKRGGADIQPSQADDYDVEPTADAWVFTAASIAEPADLFPSDQSTCIEALPDSLVSGSCDDYQDYSSELAKSSHGGLAHAEIDGNCCDGWLIAVQLSICTGELWYQVGYSDGFVHYLHNRTMSQSVRHLRKFSLELYETEDGLRMKSCFESDVIPLSPSEWINKERIHL